MPEISSASLDSLAPLQLPNDRQLVMRVSPMPADANGNGDIFGGWIMAQVDLAGAVIPARIAKGRIATVAVNQFVFKQPVSMGDLLSFYAKVTRIGKTSVTVNVEVFAERNPADLHVVKVTEANLTYVAIDRNGRPRAFSRPPEARAAAGALEAIVVRLAAGAHVGARAASGRRLGRELPGIAFRDDPAAGRRGEWVPSTSTGRSAWRSRKARRVAASLLRIDIEMHRPVRLAALDRVVHQVAGDHGLLPSEPIRTLTCPGVWPGVGSRRTSDVMTWSHSTGSASPASITGCTESTMIWRSSASPVADQCASSMRPNR